VTGGFTIVIDGKRHAGRRVGKKTAGKVRAFEVGSVSEGRFVVDTALTAAVTKATAEATAKATPKPTPAGAPKSGPAGS